jgi:hypothetical protein
MTTITIVPESTGKGGIIYRAKAGTLQSEGRSAGEALDTLTTQLGEAAASIIVVIQLQPEKPTHSAHISDEALTNELLQFYESYESYEAEAGTIRVIQRSQPDVFFTAAQQQRLSELMARWRKARDQNSQLLPEEQTELEQLIEAEVQAATRRAESAIAELKK